MIIVVWGDTLKARHTQIRHSPGIIQGPASCAHNKPGDAQALQASSDGFA